MSKNREFDVVVYGATGFTGRLVAEYLAGQYGVGKDLKWAMAGRSEDKLAAVRDEIGAPKDVPFVVADASDTASLKAMAERTSVVLTTVGPYQLYGSDLVAACAEAGTDYVDLCGEVNWMHQMIAAHSDKAKETGARIVLSCGFDSIPFDLGVYFPAAERQGQAGRNGAAGEDARACHERHLLRRYGRQLPRHHGAGRQGSGSHQHPAEPVRPHTGLYRPGTAGGQQAGI